MGETKAYKGSCHCGKVSYRVSVDLSAELATCNCSICGRTGALMAFVPAAAFTLERGEDAQTDYQFNKKTIHHLFCTTCGVRSYAHGKGPDGSDMYSINVRCLEGVELSALRSKEYDGRSL
jgi:hypothetical protein